MKELAGPGAVPFLRQLAGPSAGGPLFCIEMKHRRGGMLHINHECAGPNRLRLVRGVHWYLTPLVDVRVGGVPVAEAAGLRYCMFDTGSNMLGSSPDVHRALAAALRRAPGSTVEVRLRREDGVIYTYAIPAQHLHVDGRAHPAARPPRDRPAGCPDSGVARHAGADHPHRSGRPPADHRVRKYFS